MKKQYLQPAIRAHRIIINRLMQASVLMTTQEASVTYTSLDGSNDGGNGDAKPIWGCTFGCTFSKDE